MGITIELQDVGCPLGCARDDDRVLTARDLLNGLLGEFSVMRCKSCGLMRTNPRPTVNSIYHYYPDSYGPYKVTVQETATQSKSKQRLKDVLKLNHVRLPSQLRPGRMLEIGCATGNYLQRMARMGWEVQGIEFSPSAAKVARSAGYSVYSGPLETAPAPEKTFDLVVAWMVLEHLHDPVWALHRLRQWTRRGGWLVVSVPNAGSWEFSVFGNKWYALQVPTHLSHFTPSTVRLVLQRTGWDVKRLLHHQSLSNLIGSFGHVLEESGIAPTIGAALTRFPETPGWGHYALFPLAAVASWFGQTGRMTVWSRNPP